MKVIKDLECMVMACGEPTLPYCMDSIKAQTYQPRRIIKIENYSPISDSINKRHEEMQLPFSIKVDADMILYPFCFQVLYEVLRQEKGRFYAVTAMLLDPFIGKMGAVHMERSELVKDVSVPNVIGCDRAIRQIMLERGYHIRELPQVVGEHWCDWSAEAIFKRHVRIGQKHFFYGDKHHNDWIRSIGRKWMSEKDGSFFLALLGYCCGLLRPDEMEKGVVFANAEWSLVDALIKDGVIPKPKGLLRLRRKSKGNEVCYVKSAGEANTCEI